MRQLGIAPGTDIFARTHRLLTIYDSLYALLPQMVGAELWTADQRLLQLVASIARSVRWLGDYPLTWAVGP